jgi:hypothetical protein
MSPPDPRYGEAVQRRWQLYAVGSELEATRVNLRWALAMAKGRKRLPKWLMDALTDAHRHADLAMAEYRAASQAADAELTQATPPKLKVVR